MAHRPDPGFPFGAYTAWRWATPVAHGLGRWWVDYRQGGTPLPPGPVVVAANHFSHVDPVVVGMATGRPVRFLAVDELFGRSRFFDGLTHWLGAIPMSRTRAPLGALRTALAELAAGGTVGLFPEGIRVYSWGERPPKRGAAWLARRAGVPLVPIAIHGTDRVLGRDGRGIRRHPVRVMVCEPISPAEHDSAAEMIEAWRQRVDQALREMGRES